MSKFLVLSLSLLSFGLATLAVAAEKEEEERIAVEIVGKLQTGIFAIGGETTGTIITVKNVTWELDLGKNKDLEELAKKLDKQTVVVTGAYEKRKGVEVKERHIVMVKTLKAAGGK